MGGEGEAFPGTEGAEGGGACFTLPSFGTGRRRGQNPGCGAWLGVCLGHQQQ